MAPAATPAARGQKPKGPQRARAFCDPAGVAQLGDRSRVNSSSYRNEALASHGGSQVLNVAPQAERNPGHSGAMADASKAADAVDATGSLSVGALAVPDSGRLEACSICEAFSPTATAAIADHCEDNCRSPRPKTGCKTPRGAAAVGVYDIFSCACGAGGGRIPLTCLRHNEELRLGLDAATQQGGRGQRYITASRLRPLSGPAAAGAIYREAGLPLK